MPPATGTLLIPGDIGSGWGIPQFEKLVQNLELRLKQPVGLCFLDDSSTRFAAGLKTLLDAGVGRVVVLPVGLLPLSNRALISESLEWARQRWPALNVHFAAPLAWLDWSGWLRVTALDTLQEMAIPPSEAAIVLAGRESTNPLTNADLARLAQLVQDSIPQASVRHAFLGTARPTLSQTSFALSGAKLRGVVVLPWLITDDDSVRQLNRELSAVSRADEMNVTFRTPSLAHPAFINVLVSNHCAALADDALQMPVRAGRGLDVRGGSEPIGGAPQAEITAEEALELRELERRIIALLPSEYQGRYEDVSPQSMGTAPLTFDNDGKVAWDQIWTSFCDLALAGGPPHRGSLLEAVTPAEALTEPEKYQEVVAEIERGIRLVTGLTVVPSRTPGWVGIRCDSEEMAIWLLRAIIVENIMVRREADVLYLPAGPHFTLKREIKNVITAVAKTVHYWRAHLLTRRQREGDLS